MSLSSSSPRFLAASAASRTRPSHRTGLPASSSGRYAPHDLAAERGQPVSRDIPAKAATYRFRVAPVGHDEAEFPELASGPNRRHLSGEGVAPGVPGRGVQIPLEQQPPLHLAEPRPRQGRRRVFHQAAPLARELVQQPTTPVVGRDEVANDPDPPFRQARAEASITSQG